MKRTSDSRPVTVFACMILSVLTVAAAASAQEYKIKLHRPLKAGDSYKFSATGNSSMVRTITPGQAVPAKQEEKIEVVLAGNMKVLEVNSIGEATKSECTVTKCSVNGQSICDEGDVIQAEFANGDKTYTVKGAKADEATARALGVVMHCADPASKSTDDMLFGTDKPQKVGDSWPVHPEAMAESLAEHGHFTAKPEDVHGEAKLVSVKQIDGKDVLSLELDAAVNGARPALPATATVEKSVITVHMSVQLPADETAQQISLSDVMDMKFQATMTGPDNQKVQVDISAHESTDSSIPATKSAR